MFTGNLYTEKAEYRDKVVHESLPKFDQENV